MRATSVARILAVSALLLLAAAPPAHAQRSRAMAQECRGASASTPANRQRAEQWVQDRLKAFLPTPEQTLRMRSIELQAEQVKLAMYGISSTCEQYLGGKMAKEDADLTLSGFEQTIADFLSDPGGQVVPVAARGQVADITAIRETLTDIGNAGRQAALLGEDDLAEQSRKRLVDALVTFSRAFVGDACFSQSFDPEIAMALERQNELLGTGIDVTPCAKRKFSADATAADIRWRFAHCGLGIGEWKITTEGPLQGTGIATIEPGLSGTWYVDETTSNQDVRLQYSGVVRLFRKSAAGDADASEPYRLFLQATDATVTADGKVLRRPVNLSGYTFVVKVSDTPCRANDESS